MNESVFKNNVMGWLKGQPKVFVWKNEALFKRGFPDLTIIREGTVHFIELKVSHNKTVKQTGSLRMLTPIQHETVNQMLEARAQVYVAVYYDKIKKVHLIQFIQRDAYNSKILSVDQYKKFLRSL